MPKKRWTDHDTRPIRDPALHPPPAPRPKQMALALLKVHWDCACLLGPPYLSLASPFSASAERAADL